MKIRFLWFFSHSTNVCFSSGTSELPTATLNKDFLKSLRIFSPIFLTILDTAETETFFCATLVFFWHGLFSNVFLRASWLTTWSLPYRGQSCRAFRLQTLFHPMNVVQLTFNCFEISVFWKPARNKGYWIFLSFTERYLRFSYFLQIYILYVIQW